MRRVIFLIGLIQCCGVVATSAADSFDSYWHDGKAELNGYRLKLTRYGQPRDGKAVLIYVTEPFSAAKRVKLDEPAKHPGDAVTVLKLNLVRDFQTGIYDYNTMVSAFVDTSNFAPLKISFSSAEWCGHVYEELQFTSNQVAAVYHSYFEGESGDTKLEVPPGGVAEDNLWILLRGLRREFLPASESRDVPFLPGVFHNRLAHQPLKWTTASIQRLAQTESVKVPAGTFESIVYEIKIADGRTGRFHIEAAYPHRIVRWELLPDIAAELTGSARLEYWKLHDNGDERYLRELGLEQ